MEATTLRHAEFRRESFTTIDAEDLTVLTLGFCLITLMKSSISARTRRRLIHTLTRLTLHTLQPFRDFLCGILDPVMGIIVLVSTAPLDRC